MRRVVPSLFVFILGCASVPPATPAQRAQVHVVLYTTSWCGACAATRSWLYDHGVPFDDHDVESSAAAAARLRSLNPSGTVPVINVEGRILYGFVPEELRAAVDTAAHRY